MNRNVLMTLLETVVFADVVKVITADDDSSLHLGLGDDTSQDSTTNSHIAGEGALLIDVVALDGLNQR